MSLETAPPAVAAAPAPTSAGSAPAAKAPKARRSEGPVSYTHLSTLSTLSTPERPMLIDLSLTGQRVAIVGDDAATRRARARYLASGARLRLLTTPSLSLIHI